MQKEISICALSFKNFKYNCDRWPEDGFREPFARKGNVDEFCHTLTRSPHHPPISRRKTQVYRKSYVRNGKIKVHILIIKNYSTKMDAGTETT